MTQKCYCDWTLVWWWFRIRIGWCFEHTSRIKIGFGYNWNLSDRIIKFQYLHNTDRRAGRQAALQNGPVGCWLSWAAEKGRPEGCPSLQPAPPFCTARWPALLSFVQPASPPTVHVIHLETRSYSPPPISVIRVCFASGSESLRQNVCWDYFAFSWTQVI